MNSNHILAYLLLAIISCSSKVESQTKVITTSDSLEKTIKKRALPIEAGELLVDTIPKKKAVFTTAYLMGKFDPATHPDFVKIVPPYADNNERYLRKDTYEAFKKMHAAAQKEGVNLVIISATRNFESQKGIWEAKWTGERLVDDQDISQTIPDPKKRALKILEYSSMPGSSRHHWGTDIDLNNLSDNHFQSGEGKKVYTWLRANAAQYGFCQPYSPKGADRPAGYNEEKWHWSYLPISKKLTALAAQKLKDDMIAGFKGAETAKSIGIVKKYVLGINQECLE